MKIVFAGLMEVLTRWFACQRSLKGDSQALQIVGRSGGAVFSRRVYRYDHGSAADAHAQMEARSVAEALGASDASFSDDEWERCLPQITTALVDHSPSRLAVASSAHRQLLSFALRDALVQRIVAKPEMGLKTCWLLQDALLEERNTLEAGRTDLGAYFDAVYGPYDENQRVGGAPNRKEASLNFARLQTLLVLFFGDSNVGLEAATALGERFRGLGQDPRQTMAAATDMIRRSHDSDRAKQYDWYQWKTNGIVP
ncbi:phosphatidylinositol kinase [Aureococcus anophagefferens]|nr:phosphatidylinositol kinase [Aureococcus anophagefferens]